MRFLSYWGQDFLSTQFVCNWGKKGDGWNKRNRTDEKNFFELLPSRDITLKLLYEEKAASQFLGTGWVVFWSRFWIGKSLGLRCRFKTKLGLALRYFRWETKGFGWVWVGAHSGQSIDGFDRISWAGCCGFLESQKMGNFRGFLFGRKGEGLELSKRLIGDQIGRKSRRNNSNTVETAKNERIIEI